MLTEFLTLMISFSCQPINYRLWINHAHHIDWLKLIKANSKKIFRGFFCESLASLFDLLMVFYRWIKNHHQSQLTCLWALSHFLIVHTHTQLIAQKPTALQFSSFSRKHKSLNFTFMVLATHSFSPDDANGIS